MYVVGYMLPNYETIKQKISDELQSQILFKFINWMIFLIGQLNLSMDMRVIGVLFCINYIAFRHQTLPFGGCNIIIIIIIITIIYYLL